MSLMSVGMAVAMYTTLAGLFVTVGGEKVLSPARQELVSVRGNQSRRSIDPADLLRSDPKRRRAIQVRRTAMTMQMQVLYLTIAYAALGSMLLIVLSRLAIPRAAKIGVIAAMGVFNVAVFFWSQSLLGWSAATAVPEKFQVLWTRVVEPNPSQQFAGAIHLWVEELDERNIPSGEPPQAAILREGDFSIPRPWVGSRSPSISSRCQNRF
jgi:hypothetical protein